MVPTNIKFLAMTLLWGCNENAMVQSMFGVGNEMVMLQ